MKKDTFQMPLQDWENKGGYGFSQFSIITSLPWTLMKKLAPLESRWLDGWAASQTPWKSMDSVGYTWWWVLQNLNASQCIIAIVVLAIIKRLQLNQEMD